MQTDFPSFVIKNAKNNRIIDEIYIEKAGGFGLRNYWIKPLYESIKKMNLDYKKWKTKY